MTPLDWIRRHLGWALLLGSAVHAQTQSLAVCVAEDNAPLSQVVRGSAPRGLDVRIAQAIAADMGRELRIVPFDTQYEMESTLAQEVNALLSAGICELASGFPLVRDDLGAPQRATARTPDYPGAKRRRERPFITLQPLKGSRAYIAMALGVAVRDAALVVRSLADLRETRIGAIPGTVSSSILMMYRNGLLRPRIVSLTLRDDLLEQMAGGRFDAALVPTGRFDAWHQKQPGSSIVLAGYRRPLGINLGFVAVAAGDAALASASRVIERALADGSLERWAQAEGTTWSAPTAPEVSRGISIADLSTE